jgi:hypothetical protein
MARNKAEMAILARLARDADERLICCHAGKPKYFFLQWPQLAPPIWDQPFNCLLASGLITPCFMPAVQRHSGLSGDAALHYLEAGEAVYTISAVGLERLLEHRIRTREHFERNRAEQERAA